MAPVPEMAFRVLLAGRPRSAFADFVTDLWRARGHEVRRNGDRLIVDGRVLYPVKDVDAAAPDADRLVVATSSSGDAGDAVVGPADLHRMLLYDVPRERAADLFESHFGRPLDDDWSDLTGGSPDADRGSAGEPTTARSGDGAPPPVIPTPVRRLLVPGAVRLSRDPRELGGVADLRHLLAVLGAVVVLSAAVGWGLFGYQPAPAAPTPLPFETDGSELPGDGSYRVTGQFHTTVDGETFSVTGTRTYAPGDPAVALARWTYGGPDGRTTVVRYERNGSYTRRTWTNDSDYRRFRDGARGDEDVVRAVDASRTVYSADRDSTGADAGLDLRFPLSVLGMVPYDRGEATTYGGREVVRYVPRTGWVTRTYGLLDDRQTTRVRAASGEVLIDAGSDAVLYADVEATVVKAGTWWGAFTTRPTHVSVRYSVEQGVDRPGPPPWVEGSLGNATSTPGSSKLRRVHP